MIRPTVAFVQRQLYSPSIVEDFDMPGAPGHSSGNECCIGYFTLVIMYQCALVCHVCRWKHVLSLRRVCRWTYGASPAVYSLT